MDNIVVFSERKKNQSAMVQAVINKARQYALERKYAAEIESKGFLKR